MLPATAAGSEGSRGRSPSRLEEQRTKGAYEDGSGKGNFELVRERQSRDAHESGAAAQSRKARRHREAGDPAGGPGIRAWTRKKLCRQSTGLRSEISFPTGD